MEKSAPLRTTKHICHRCKHKHLELIMHQVSIQNGDYRMWTPSRAAYFRNHKYKYPTLAWLCRSCSHPNHVLPQ